MLNSRPANCGRLASLREKMILETPAAAAAAAPVKKAVTKSPPRARRIRQARA